MAGALCIGIYIRGIYGVYLPGPIMGRTYEYMLICTYIIWVKKRA
jgi:hypothetical protein